MEVLDEAVGVLLVLREQERELVAAEAERHVVAALDEQARQLDEDLVAERGGRSGRCSPNSSTSTRQSATSPPDSSARSSASRRRLWYERWLPSPVRLSVSASRVATFVESAERW